MGRILAIDYGTRRTGLAATDPSQLIASPLETVATHELLPWLKRYVAAEQVSELVVGMPRTLANDPTDTTPHVVGLVRTLRRTFPGLPVHEVDERLTSVLAHQTMRSGGLGRQARQDKALVDRISATLILQSFLERRANGLV